MTPNTRRLHLEKFEQRTTDLIAVGAGILAGVATFYLVRKAFKAEFVESPPDISISSGSTHLWKVDEDSNGNGKAFHSLQFTGDYSHWRVVYSPDLTSVAEELTMGFEDTGKLTLSSGGSITLTTQTANHRPELRVKLMIKSTDRFSPGSGTGHWQSDDPADRIKEFTLNSDDRPRPAGSYPQFSFYVA